MTRIAVNVCDMLDLRQGPGADFAVQLMFADFIVEPYQSFMVDKKFVDTGAAVLNGPAAQDEKRLESFILWLQTSAGPRLLGRRFRCYEEGPRGGWKEVNLAGRDRAPLHATGDSVDPSV